jgi:FkbM family methyltransferase
VALVSTRKLARPAASEAPAITFDGARFAAEAALAVAEERGAAVVVAVVDPAAELVYLLRPDDAEPGQVEATLAKARSAIEGPPAEGAASLEHAGSLVGSIGVSGGNAAGGDAELAGIAADAIADGRYRPYRVAAGLIYLDVSESVPMQRRAIGKFEADKVRALQELLKPGMTFVDVGANKGDFTLLAAKVMGDRGRVLAFEPVPDNLHWLRKSIALNGYRSVEVIEIALSDTAGRAPIHLGTFSGWHSLVHTEGGTGETIEVETRTLDSVLEERGGRADVIKIDVEGAELQVLRGAERTLGAGGPLTVFVECHPHRGVDPAEIWDVFATHGFSFRDPTAIGTELPGRPEKLRDIVAVRPG